MTTSDGPGSAGVHGRLWGARARDWAELQEGQHRSEYEAIFDRLAVGPGTLYCDVGCASGVAASIASARGANVCGLDAAAALIAIASERVPSGDFRVGEMEELPFADATFDVVTGFRAFNYATRPQVALAEARRVLRREGRIVMTTWGKPEGMGAAAMIDALTPLLPPRGPDKPGIYALSDEAALLALIESAGLHAMTVDHIHCVWTYPDLVTALRGFASSGRAVRAIECTSKAAVDDAHEAALRQFRQRDGSYRIGSTQIVVVARR